MQDRLLPATRATQSGLAAATLPVAVGVMPQELHRAPQGRARGAWRKLLHPDQVERGGHVAARAEPASFSAGLGTAVRPLRRARTVKPGSHDLQGDMA